MTGMRVLQLNYVEVDNHAGHRADRNALEEHRGAHAQALEGFIEVQKRICGSSRRKR